MATSLAGGRGTLGGDDGCGKVFCAIVVSKKVGCVMMTVGRSWYVMDVGGRGM